VLDENIHQFTFAGSTGSRLGGDHQPATESVTRLNDWNTALANGSIACWISGAWGPALIESAAADQAGQWRVFSTPQWTAGEKVNGNYGGSTSVVMKATAHPKEAETFARWLNTDPQTVLD
jgi:multiple sugar transport system substrate-binding protein